MNETKTQLIQTGFTLDRLHQDGKIDDEAYTILKDRNKQAINYSQCCTQLNHVFKTGDDAYIVSKKLVEILDIHRNGKIIQVKDGEETYIVDGEELEKVV